jgi:hypothetical protein
MWFVSIILLNYNGKRFNKPCIDSILQQNYQNFEIIFVDNSSTDWSLEEVKKIYQKESQSRKIIIIESKKNTWFAWGNNLWVQHASRNSEYICLLNNDTTVPKNRLRKLMDGIQSNATLWAISWMILDVWYEAQTLEIYKDKKEVFTPNIFGEIVINKISPKEAKTWIYYTAGLSGCCFLYKRSIIEKPFPDFYFAYTEDIFLSRYILYKWYTLGISTESIIHHHGSWSFGKKPSNFKLFYGNRNQIINYLVFYNISTIVKLLPLFLITQISHLFINSFWKRLWAKIKAWTWICKHSRQIRKLRKFIQENKKIQEKEFIQHLSYKFNDNIPRWNFWKITVKIIRSMNKIFTSYCRYFLYK